MSSWHASEGMGCRVPRGLLGMEPVDEGVKGELVAGVRRALSDVESVSSIEDRESRRKSRRARSLKQNWGVSPGGGYGWDIIRVFGEG